MSSTKKGSKKAHKASIVLFDYHRLFDTLIAFIKKEPNERIRLWELADQGVKVSCYYMAPHNKRSEKALIADGIMPVALNFRLCIHSISHSSISQSLAVAIALSLGCAL